MTPNFKMAAETIAAANQIAQLLSENKCVASCNPLNTRNYMSKVSIEKNGQKQGNICVYSDAAGKISLRFHEYKGPDADTLGNLCNSLNLASSINTDKGSLSKPPSPTPEPPKLTRVALENAVGSIHAYTDGSFLDDNNGGRTGFGVLIVDSANNVITEISGRIENSSSRQIIGEISAALAAMEWAKKNNVAQLTIHADYAGIIHWATGEWKTKTSETIAYANSVRNCRVSLEFKKAKAHSTDRLNQRADELANTGAKLPMNTVAYDGIFNHLACFPIREAIQRFKRLSLCV